MSKVRQTVDCGFCTGHGIGGYAMSRCEHCGGKGYFELDDDEWSQYCEENNLNPETGEEIEEQDNE